MDVVDLELTALWGRVIDAVALDAPQHRAFLTLTKGVQAVFPFLSVDVSTLSF